MPDYSQFDVNEIVGRDPRVQLMERLYTDPDAKKALQVHSKRLFPGASIPEIDIPAEMEAKLDELRKDNAALRKLIESDKKDKAHEAFRARLVDAGADPKDLEKIEAFMVDNELGPKAVKVAVEKYYEGQETAEPTATGDTLTFPWQREPSKDDKDAQHLKRLVQAGPGEDLDLLNTPWAEHVFNETVQAMQPQQRRGR